MHDHAGHTLGMPMTSDAAKQSTPTTPNTAEKKAPAKPDPHAGHDMGKSDKSGSSQKGVEKK
ncbi:MAG: hypothetical protein ABI877_03075 [Gemmatimonadaceae bacterium]